MRTNIGAKFISLVKKHFPKNSPLYSIFNTKKLKVSYRTTANMASQIAAHNRKMLGESNEDIQGHGCNCKKGVESCPMSGQCLEKGIVYRADVSTENRRRHYYGLTARRFKQRYYEHQQDLRHEDRADSTTLAGYVWWQRGRGIEPDVTWSKVCSANAYRLGGKACQLCLAEKTQIASDVSGLMLNRRRELMNKCRHKGKFLLDKFCSVDDKEDSELDDHNQSDTDQEDPTIWEQNQGYVSQGEAVLGGQDTSGDELVDLALEELGGLADGDHGDPVLDEEGQAPDDRSQQQLDGDAQQQSLRRSKRIAERKHLALS